MRKRCTHKKFKVTWILQLDETPYHFDDRVLTHFTYQLDHLSFEKVEFLSYLTTFCEQSLEFFCVCEGTNSNFQYLIQSEMTSHAIISFQFSDLIFTSLNYCIISIMWKNAKYFTYPLSLSLSLTPCLSFLRHENFTLIKTNLFWKLNKVIKLRQRLK